MYKQLAQEHIYIYIHTCLKHIKYIHINNEIITLRQLRQFLLTLRLIRGDFDDLTDPFLNIG